MSDPAASASAGASGEIRPGVHRIDTWLGDRFASLFLFVGSERAVLFDSGVAGAIPASVLPYLLGAGIPPEAIEQVVISHCDVDHFGGIGDVRAALPRARVVAHHLDADAMEDFAEFLVARGTEFAARFAVDPGPAAVDWMRDVVSPGRVDERLTAEVDVDLGDRRIRILHVPGHSRGHLAIHDPANGLIAISDAVLGEVVPTGNGDPAFPPTYRHERDYLETIERLRDLRPDLLATAHFGVLEGAEVGRFLDVSGDFATGLRQEVLQTIVRAGTELTLEELLVDLNARIGLWPKEGAETALAFPVVGHLEQLELEGAIGIREAPGGARLSAQLLSV